MLKAIVFSFTTILAAAAIATPIAAGPCRGTIKTAEFRKCVKVVVSALNVREGSATGEDVVCQFKRNRKFWTESGAATQDGRRWYGVRLRLLDDDHLDDANGYISELHRGNLTIKKSSGC